MPEGNPCACHCVSSELSCRKTPDEIGVILLDSYVAQVLYTAEVSNIDSAILAMCVLKKKMLSVNESRKKQENCIH